MIVALLAIPLIATLLLLGLPDRRFARATSLLPLLFLLYGGSEWLGSSVFHPWIPQFGVNLDLRVDGISLLFLYLTAIITPIVMMVAKESSSYPLISSLQALLIGFFTARDLVLFALFWEAMLLPLFFMIKPAATALKFFVTMVAGSCLMLLAVIGYSSSLIAPQIILPLFLLAFAVKTPLFPFHGWLADTYTQSPLAATILLSAVLSKAGIYGFVRIGLGLFPEIMASWNPLLLSCAIVGVFYGLFAAWTVCDYKRMIAYISLSHVNFILVGLFIGSSVAEMGALMQAFNHSITITALFLVAGWLEERMDSRLQPIRGLITFFPLLGWTTLLFLLSAVALPGTNNFVGEVLILFGALKGHFWIAFLLGITIILSVVALLRFMEQIYFGPTAAISPKRDIGLQEFLIVLPLILLTLGLGIYPAPLIDVLTP